MHHVLIVDDELIQRRVLANIARKHQPECVVYEAANGKLALETVHNHPIDVIVTDIKMPVMDGLSFIEAIHQIIPSAKIIILSGYRQFDYAQRALRLGAFDYLVKPVKEERIIKMLDDAYSALRNEASLQNEKESLEKQLKSALPVYQDHLLNNWIKGVLKEEDVFRLQQQSELYHTGYVIVLKWTALQETDRLSQKGFRERLVQQTNQELLEAGPVKCFLDLENETLMYVLLKADKPYDYERFYMAFNKMNKQTENEWAVYASAGMSHFHDGLVEHGKEAREEAVFAMTYTFYLDNEQFIRFEDVPSMLPDVRVDLEKEAEAMKESLRQAKPELFHGILDAVFERLFQNGYIEPKLLKKIVFHYTLNVIHVLKNFVEDDLYNEALAEIELELHSVQTLSELRSVLLDKMGAALKHIQQTKSKKHEMVIEKCMIYIQDHYMDDIHLETFSALFHFSPNYLNMLFKDHTGMTFSKYLSKVRLNKAVELLEKSDHKVYEIASKVGYVDEKYFYRVFKRKFGFTPEEYRRLL